ncbi:DUF4199 domain-containing protein [Mucilaginibacter sp. AW1-3]
MKKIVLVFGSISALILILWIAILATLCYKNHNFEGNMWMGYGSMLVAFSFIFVGIKNYRDNYSNGFVTFGKAFQIGLYIALIASTGYVLAWLVDFYAFMPDFMDKYVAHQLAYAKSHGATAAEIAAKKEQMAGYANLYKTPIGVIALTYLEVLPVGLIIALIAALILKRKPQQIMTA